MHLANGYTETYVNTVQFTDALVIFYLSWREQIKDLEAAGSI